MSDRKDLIFLLSIDTEEEWDWSGDFPHENFSVTNVVKIAQFHEFCEKHAIRPTYFTDYAVANDPASSDILRTILSHNTCEIGAHLHPWCNPPYYGRTGEKESHVVNLPIDQVERKLDSLIEILIKNLNTTPNAFRTGRWGINGKILSLLEKKGFQIDSSMFPYFTHEYFDCDQTPLLPYWPDYENPMTFGSQRNLMEIPVTVGFNRKNYDLMRSVYNNISHPHLDKLRLVAIFWHTFLMRKLYLSPEMTTSHDMCLLVNTALANDLPVIHMFLHSSSLIDGATGFMKQRDAFNVICENIESVIEHSKNIANVKFCTISEAAILLKQRQIEL